MKNAYSELMLRGFLHADDEIRHLLCPVCGEKTAIVTSRDHQIGESLSIDAACPCGFSFSGEAYNIHTIGEEVTE